MNAPDVTEVTTCRVCGNNDWLEVLSLGTVPLANGYVSSKQLDTPEPTYPVEVITCQHCWLMAIRHVVDPSSLFRQYVYTTSDSELITGHMNTIVEWASSKAQLQDESLVVELGSNIGTQLSLFQDRGFRVVGVDPAENLVAQANASGVESIADFFGPNPCSQIVDRHGRASFVLGRQCFAHIDNVHEVMDGIETVLDDEGMFAIEVPYLVDLLEQNQFDTIYHEHLSYYSLGTLQSLYVAHGFRLIDVMRANVHGGSIITLACRDTASHHQAAAVSELLEAEEQMGLRTPTVYQEFGQRSEQMRGAIRKTVLEHVAAGKRVAGYGTPSKGVALLQACGLGADAISYCVDTTPGKQGRYLPGSHIPVIAPEQSRSQLPDLWILLAWNYAEEIIDRERDFLDEGGEILVPIPSPRLVSKEALGVAG